VATDNPILRAHVEAAAKMTKERCEEVIGILLGRRG
jgi:hypothetical protein